MLPPLAGERVDLPAIEEWRAQAIELMREADERLRNGDLAGFGAAWNRLRALLLQQTPGTF